MTMDFKFETIETRKKGCNILQVLKEKTINTKSFTQRKRPSEMKKKIKTFSHEQKTRRICH